MTSDQWLLVIGTWALVLGTWVGIYFTWRGLRDTIKENRGMQERDFDQKAEAQEKRFEQQLNAQRDQFRLTVRNDARLKLTDAIISYVGQLGSVLVQLTMHSSEGALREAASVNASVWICLLEDYENLYPETAEARVLLLRANRGLTLAIRDTCLRARKPDSFGQLRTDPTSFPLLDELINWIADLQGLLEDLRIHLQNECLCPIARHERPRRAPSDMSCPRLVMNEGKGQLEISPPLRSPLSE